MDEHENKLFQTIWRAVAGCLCVFIVTIASCNVVQNNQDNETLVKIVQAGSDAMSAKCAMSGMSSYACMIIASQKRN